MKKIDWTGEHIMVGIRRVRTFNYICEDCGETVVSYFNKKCVCQIKEEKITLARCKGCGETFNPRSNRQVYCNNKCYPEAFKRSPQQANWGGLTGEDRSYNLANIK